jgi:hypothetical protein
LGAGTQFRRDRIQRATHIVGDDENVTGKRRDTIKPRLGHFTVGALAHVLHLGKRP